MGVEVPLTRGFVAIVDEVDAEAVLAVKWHPKESAKSNTVYAHRNVKRGPSDSWTTESLHRFIVRRMYEAPVPFVDHVDGNGLDCRRFNLRPATRRQNRANAGPQRTNKSGFRGVCWHRGEARWVAQLGKPARHLGSFSTAEAAARVYDEWMWAQFGEFARLNFERGKHA